MLEKTSPRQILCQTEQDKIDKTLIEETLKKYNLKENVDIIHRFACECLRKNISQHTILSLDSLLKRAIDDFQKQEELTHENDTGHNGKFDYPIRID